MSAGSPISLPVFGSDIKTACGEAEKFAANTPRALYKGKWIFFCLPVCQKEFLDDPSSSCYANQIENEAE
jgi:YHS domain-containing protein